MGIEIHFLMLIYYCNVTEKRGDSSSTAGEILASYLETYLVPFAVSASSGTTRAAMHSEVNKHL